MDKEIELIKTNYATVHDSVQSAHRISWTITGIFVPVAFGIVAFVLKEPMHLFLKLAVLSGSFLLIWFWKKLLEFLGQLNEIRINKLRSIEDYITINISGEKGYDFSYYNLIKEQLEELRQKGEQVRFNELVDKFYMIYIKFISIMIVVIIFVALID